MTPAQWAVQVVCGLVVVASMLSIVRSTWVLRQRVRRNLECRDQRLAVIAAGGWREVQDLPWWDEDYLTFTQMWLRFWIWDLEKMRK